MAGERPSSKPNFSSTLLSSCWGSELLLPLFRAFRSCYFGGWDWRMYYWHLRIIISNIAHFSFPWFLSVPFRRCFPKIVQVLFHKHRKVVTISLFSYPYHIWYPHSCQFFFLSIAKLALSLTQTDYAYKFRHNQVSAWWTACCWVIPHATVTVPTPDQAGMGGKRFTMCRLFISWADNTCAHPAHLQLFFKYITKSQELCID